MNIWGVGARLHPAVKPLDLECNAESLKRVVRSDELCIHASTCRLCPFPLQWT